MDAVVSREIAALMPQQRSILIDDWLSPRTRKMLLLTAELDQSNFDDANRIFDLRNLLYSPFDAQE